MSLIIELFGEDVVKLSPEEFKDSVSEIDFTWPERRSYMMHEYSKLTGHKWSYDDFTDVNGRSR